MKKQFKQWHGVSQYKDIHWWVYELDEPIEGYSTVYLNIYAITEEMMDIAGKGETQRDATTPDIDKRGTGNIHPSINDTIAAAKDPMVRQLVLQTRRRPKGQFGVALPEDQKCDGLIYHLYKADVPAANYYPLITELENPTETELRKQAALKGVAELFRAEGLPISDEL